MQIDLLIDRIREGYTPSLEDIQPLTPEELTSLIERMKTEADRHFFIDPKISLHFATLIVLLGELTQNRGFIALGTMSSGDSHRHLKDIPKAWEYLHRAGEIYLETGDEVGWARTIIGKFGCCIEMNAIESTLEEAERAREIFLQHNVLPKLLSLEVNISYLLNYTRSFNAAIDKLNDVEQLMQRMGKVDSHRLIFVYSNRGTAFLGLGELREALHWFLETRRLMQEHGEQRGIPLINLYIINVYQALGQNKRALLLLYETLPALEESNDFDNIREQSHIIECYLYFKRYADALHLMRQAVESLHDSGTNMLYGEAFLQLGLVEMALGHFREAFEAFRRAESTFVATNAEGWFGLVNLYRGQAALQSGDIELAQRATNEALDRLHKDEHQIYHLMALLLQIRIDIAAGSLSTARDGAFIAQKMTRNLGVPHIRYEAHVLSGNIAERTAKPGRAIRHYQVATRIMEQIQRSLVLTSRAEFLVDKQESVQALIRLYLNAGDSEAAFTTLERSKAQVWLSYLSQLDHLQWITDDSDTHALIERLKHLREDHYWNYRIAYDQIFRESQLTKKAPEDAVRESMEREHEIRQLTEQLYLYSSVEHLAEINPVSTAEIQAYLRKDAPMITYYNDGKNLTAFVLDGEQLHVYPLAVSAANVEKLIEKWQSNISRALRTIPGSSEGQILTGFAQTIGRQLYEALIQPFAEHLKNCERLYIVPYGALHYIPFHLLSEQQGYLIECFEIVMLSTASLITRQPPHQPRGALSVAYGWDGRLRHAEPEAHRVMERFGGEVYTGHDARTAVLDTRPRQVLHISAHGQYRMDNPSFSYIQLADGPLYTDDLFQYDLNYELVTLSACETGRNHAAAGDELIGLGRGFLFAGAGALIASLWRVDETLTLEFMDHLYSELDDGKSKAAALRNAQLALMQTYPGLHPAFWGAFELVGNPEPLTSHK